MAKRKPRKVKTWNIHYESTIAGWQRVGAFIQDEDWYLIGVNVSPNNAGQIHVFKGISEHADVVKTDVYWESPFAATVGGLMFLPPEHAFFISEDEQVMLDYFAAAGAETGNITLYYVDAKDW